MNNFTSVSLMLVVLGSKWMVHRKGKTVFYDVVK